MITINHPILVLIMDTLVPVVTGLITTYALVGWAKGLITLFLNSLVAFLTSVTSDGTAIFSTQTLWVAVIGFIISVVSYISIWSRTKFTSSREDSAFNHNFGIGPKIDEGEKVDE